MNHLQKDIDSLETERLNLRENLKVYSSKKGDVKQAIIYGKLKDKLFCSDYTNVKSSFKTYIKILNKNVDANNKSANVTHEILLMKKAFHNERSERMRVQINEMEKVLKGLTPIHIPQPKDNKIAELEKDLLKVKEVSEEYFTFLLQHLNVFFE